MIFLTEIRNSCGTVALLGAKIASYHDTLFFTQDCIIWRIAGPLIPENLWGFQATKEGKCQNISARHALEMPLNK